MGGKIAAKIFSGNFFSEIANRTTNLSVRAEQNPKRESFSNKMVGAFNRMRIAPINTKGHQKKHENMDKPRHLLKLKIGSFLIAI